MQVKIQSVHFVADKRLIEHVNEKVTKLGHFYDNIIGGDVTLKLDKSSEKDNKVAEIKLKVPGNDLFAKKQCKTFEEASDAAVEALRVQLKKHKEKQRSV